MSTEETRLLLLGHINGFTEGLVGLAINSDNSAYQKRENESYSEYLEKWFAEKPFVDSNIHRLKAISQIIEISNSENHSISTVFSNAILTYKKLTRVGVDFENNLQNTTENIEKLLQLTSLVNSSKFTIAGNGVGQNTDEERAALASFKRASLNFLESLVPPCFIEVSFSEKSFPKNLIYLIKGVNLDSINNFELLTKIDEFRLTEDPKIFYDSYHLRCLVINALLRFEKSGVANNKLPIFSHIFASEMHQLSSRKGALSTLVQNFIIDTIVLLQERSGCRPSLQHNRNTIVPTAISFLSNLAEITSHKTMATLLGRTIMQLDGNGVDVIQELDMLFTEEKQLQENKFRTLLIRAFNLSLHPDPHKVLLGARSIPKRRIIIASDIVNHINVDDIDTALHIDDIDKIFLEKNFLQTSFRSLGVNFMDYENKNFTKGSLQLRFDRAERKLNGRMTMQSRDKKIVYHMDYEIPLIQDPDGRLIISCEYNIFPSQKDSELQHLLVKLNRNALVCFKDRISSKTGSNEVVEIAATSESEVTNLSPTLRELKKAAYLKSNNTQKKKSQSARTSARQDLASPTTTDISDQHNSLPPLVLYSLESLRTDIEKKYREYNVIYNEIYERIEEIRLTPSKDLSHFGKRIRDKDFPNIHLRQVSMPDIAENLEIRLYFLKLKNGEFKYVGILQKTSESEQSRFIKGIFSKINESREM